MSAAAESPAEIRDEDACYRALTAHDARFDGHFFTGVISTGVYCRPVCRVRVPRRENCRFFNFAAQAEQAGFRPCLRCRPELAPGPGTWTTQDASGVLARQGARMLDELAATANETGTLVHVAQRLGVSDRHLRRIFEAHFGVAPLQYLQTRRLLNAKQLLTDTDLPVTRVALASGFGSLRRFNAAFLSRYGLNPTALRRTSAAPHARGSIIRLGYRPPYAITAMREFLARRCIGGLSFVENPSCDTALAGATLRVTAGHQTRTGWVTIRFDPARTAVDLQVSDTLCEVLPSVIAKVRAWLDLDADPAVIDACLSADASTAAMAPPWPAGLRVPGCLDGFELAVRAIVGQQITVAAARTLGERLVLTFGEPLVTPWPDLSRLFPTPVALAQADPERLGQLGIVRQRQRAIVALAQAVAGGGLQLEPSTDHRSTMEALTALPGIGNWTAQYIAMRALRWPDAFPAGDIAMQKALDLGSAREAEERSQNWRPWRSYAVVGAWHRIHAANAPFSVAQNNQNSLGTGINV